jgi:prepilin-type N-terminal cleavage/methylation domain-containing protein
MHRKNAFTLVELLVVISIIAILLSVLMPALGKARLQAKKVVCASYLKQWGLGLKLYAEDNKQSYPLGWHSPPYRQKNLLLMLSKYFGTKDLRIISCPLLDIPLPQKVFDLNNASTWYTQYCYWGGITKEACGSYWFDVPQEMKDIGLVKITDKPREVVMSDKCFSDRYCPPKATSWRFERSNWNHKAGSKLLGNNNLYGDGHVKHVDFNKLKEIKVDSTYYMMR